MKINREIKGVFFKFLNDSISIEVIKNFIIDNIFEIEKLFTKDDYFEIIDFDFNHKFSGNELKKIIEKYIDIPEYQTWKIKNELKAVINRDENLIELLLNFYNGDSNNFSFLKNLENYGCRISCYLEEPEYYDQNFIKKDIDEEFENIKIEAENILKNLDEGKIKIIGYDKFEDFR